MKPNPFRYHAPRVLDEALAMLSELEEARPLAGGQSLVPMMNLRLAAPDNLVDLNGVASLAGIEERPDGLLIRAMTRQRDAERSPLIARHCPLLIEALHHVGHQQTRNRGTIGGSIAHADPSAELPVAAMALDASLVIAGPGGRRMIESGDLIESLLTTQIAPTELLVELHVPSQGAHAGTCFTEFARRPADFAIVSCAAIVDLEAPGEVRRIAVCVGGLGYKPARLDRFEVDAKGARWGDGLLQAAIDAARNLPAEDKGEYSADYCAHLAGVLVGRCLDEAHARAMRTFDASYA